MKRIILLTIIIIALFNTGVMASETTGDTTIPEMKWEKLIQTLQARSAKVDIIKKNNKEITDLKEELKEEIVKAANKVNSLKIDIVTNDAVVITDEAIEELKVLLTFLQNSKKTLEEDVEKISSEIEQILDLISTKSMQQLDQYDLIIEKQNEVIIEMKNILQNVSKI